MEVLYQGSYLCSVKKVQDCDLLAEYGPGGSWDAPR